jgi:plasmid stabilization system protein ParE
VTTEIVFHPDAALELLETTGWYARRSRKVAARFATEMELALARIADNPRRWPQMDDKHRRLLVRRFPYLLIYRIIGERVWVIAAAHAHRKPGYWRDRRAED